MRHYNQTTGKFTFGMFILTILFLYMPLLILIIYSFNESRMMNWTGFSFRWYQELFFNSANLWRSLGNSAIVALSSAVVSTIIGTLGAIGLYWYKFRFRKTIQTAAFIPMLIPEIIVGVSLLILFAGIKMPLSLYTVFIAHTTFNVPFVLLVVMARLQGFDYTIIEAAHDLGAKELQTLWKVILPTALPGVLAGFLIAIILSLEDFVITFFVSGPGSSTLPLHINSMIRFGVTPTINALSVVIIASAIILAFLSRNAVKSLFQK